MAIDVFAAARKLLFESFVIQLSALGIDAQRCARDDDILTQFHEPDALLARLDQARSFDDVLAVIEFSRTDPDGSQDLDPDA